MAEALGVLAMQRIVERLSGMTGERPHFGATYPNAPTVEPDFKTLVAVRKFPHVCVWLEQTQDREPMQSVGTGQGYLTPYVFGLLGYTERAAGGTPMDWAIRLSEDIEITLAGGFTLGGIAHKCVISPADFDLELNVTDGVPKLAAFEMRVTVHLVQVLTVAP